MNSSLFTLHSSLEKQVLLLDGAMGTQVQAAHLAEADFRGTRFAGHPRKLEGDNDVLCLTRPDVISDIHRRYLEAGADIIETNSFNAQRISQAEYQLEEAVTDINIAAARLARAEADRMTRLTPDRPRYVAGSVGPTGRTASMSPDVENPAYRAITFDQLCAAYQEQMEALLEGGVDMLLIETIFDTLNTKAALEAARLTFDKKGKTLPVMLSVTISDAAGRTLSGQTIDAFVTSVSHAHVFSLGLNCGLGAEAMLPFLRQLSALAPCYVSAHPNAGIPNAMGEYDETPEMMAAAIRRFADERLVNIVGGCCGSTPDHIRAIAEAVSSVAEVRKPAKSSLPWLAGLEGFNAGGAFINVGERCNVAGSRKFLRLINDKQYDEALSIARKQVRDGAMVLDVNMDDGMLDARTEMTQFLNLMASDPEIARLPWMVDSSRFEVIEAALKCIQGRCIVNSVSLKEGEEKFLTKARRVKELGAALIVMAFDEEGQATTCQRKIDVCARAYHLLIDKLQFDPNDIIFDPNVLTIATGMREHDRYGLDFIEATRWIHENLPGAKVSGGVSNLSFAFRGNNYLREAMHAVFLFHAIKAGMDMAIVNPSTRVMYADIPKDLLEALEDTILCRREDASERLVDIAAKYKEVKTTAQPAQPVDRNALTLEERLTGALKQGDEEYLEADLAEALAAYPSPQAIIEGPLMQGMGIVGDLFGQGKMFLPQVVKTARTMKRAVEILQPHIVAASQKASAASNGRFIMATVKGDVHDIGKNIAAVVLQCNNFDVTDLGVMVPTERIVEAAIAEKADFIGLSGLITPSLDEMCHVATALREAGVSVPLMIGGATTSALHTAVRIAPLYDGPVFHVKDASQDPVIAMQLLGKERERTLACLRFEQERLRQSQQQAAGNTLTDEEAAQRRPVIDWSNETIVKPTYQGLRQFDNIRLTDIRPFINWIHFRHVWGVRKGTPEADGIEQEAGQLLDQLVAKGYTMRAQVGFYPAHQLPHPQPLSMERGAVTLCPCCGVPVGTSHREGCTEAELSDKPAFSDKTDPTALPAPTGITIYSPFHGEGMGVSLPRQRSGSVCRSLADYVAPQGMGDHVGVFAITVCRAFTDELEQLKADGRQYESLLMQSLGDRLVEAASEWLHREVRTRLWGYAPDEQLSVKEMYAAHYQGIRPAVGYPSLPDQRAIFTLAQLLDLPALGITLTENGAMYPQASECGLYIANRHAEYFSVKGEG